MKTRKEIKDGLKSIGYIGRVGHSRYWGDMWSVKHKDGTRVMEGQPSERVEAFIDGTGEWKRYPYKGKDKELEKIKENIKLPKEEKLKRLFE